MEINKPQLTDNNFLFAPSIDERLIEDIELDLTSKPNVFTNYSRNIQQPSTIPIEKPKIKRLNTMDNHFLLLEDNIEDKAAKESPKDINHAWVAFKSLFKKVVSKIPVINYFFLKEKQAKLKVTLQDLNSINSNVDELINLSFPMEENFDKYKIISENLIKANEIHSKIIKEIQD